MAISKDEKKLVERAQDGDQGAFEELVRRHHRRVYGLLLHMTHNPSDADDLLQDTFLRAYRGIKGFGFRSDFHTWLYRIAVNVSLNFLRKGRRKLVSFSEQLLPRDALGEGEKNPRRQAETRQLYETVLAGIEELSPDLKATLVLFSFQGLTHKQVAEILGCAEGTVAWRISEARQQLRRHLKKTKRGEGHVKQDGVHGSETETLGSP